MTLLKDGLGSGVIGRETGFSQKTLSYWRQQQRDLLTDQNPGKSPTPLIYPIDQLLNQSSQEITPLSLTFGGFDITNTAKAAH